MMRAWLLLASTQLNMVTVAGTSTMPSRGLLLVLAVGATSPTMTRDNTQMLCFHWLAIVLPVNSGYHKGQEAQRFLFKIKSPQQRHTRPVLPVQRHASVSRHSCARGECQMLSSPPAALD